MTGSARSLSSLVDQSLDKLNGKPIVGDTVVTTLDVNGQRAALDALGSNCGAVVALDPRTGRVRVMVSSPSYNPNDVEANFGRIEKIRADCTPASPLLNRATQGLYPPGSTFKVVTASAALDSGKYTPSSTFVDPGYCTVYGKRVNNFDTLAAVRHRVARERAPVLRQLRVLQHRPRARRQADPQAGEEVRLLRAPAARDARERAAGERALPQGHGSTTRGATATSTPAGWRSGRSGCS